MSRTFYDKATGRILARSFSGHGGPPVGDTIAAVDGWYDPEATYLPSGVPTARAVINYSLDKPTIVAAGGEVATVTGLPDGAVVYYETSEYATTGGSFSFDAVTPGIYDFLINQPDYLATTIRITAT